MTTVYSRLANAALANPFTQLYAHAYYQYLTSPLLYTPSTVTHGQYLDTLMGYYFSSGVYEELQIVPSVDGTDKTKSIRNPVAAFVGFYEAKLWSDPLTPMPKIGKHLEEGKEKVSEASLKIAANLTALIQDIWARSKWDDNQDLAAFRFALMGEMELKAAQREDGQPYIQTLDPRFVSEIDRDERGFLTWCRIDTPDVKRDPDTGKVTEVTVTEVWEPGRMRRWVSDRNLSTTSTTDLSQLPRGEYQEYTFDSTANAETRLLIDFIPIAYAAFKNVDNGRGFSPISLALEDIDEANQQATRLHALFFRNEQNTIVVETNYVSQTGQPMALPLGDIQQAGVVELANGTRFMALPGNATAKFLIPPLNYEQGLSMLNAQVDFIREQKLPELNYYITDSGGEESGKSRRYKLAGALDRILKARQRAEDCLARATYMCLTLGQKAWENAPTPKEKAALAMYAPEAIGRYENGDWDFEFAESEILPLTQEEIALMEETKSRTFKNYTDAGAPAEGAAKMVGHSDEQVTELLTDTGMMPPPAQ